MANHRRHHTSLNAPLVRRNVGQDSMKNTIIYVVSWATLAAVGVYAILVSRVIWVVVGYAFFHQDWAYDDYHDARLRAVLGGVIVLPCVLTAYYILAKTRDSLQSRHRMALSMGAVAGVALLITERLIDVLWWNWHRM